MKNQSGIVNNADDRIKMAIDLLNSKNVGSNLQKILNRSSFEAPDIEFKNVQELSADLLQAIKIKEINEQFSFSYKNKRLQILLTNYNKLIFPDGELYESCGLSVLFNGIWVLQDEVEIKWNYWRKTYAKGYFSAITLEKFKNGSWINDLDHLVASFENYAQQQLKSQEGARRMKIMNNIDFDSIG